MNGDRRIPNRALSVEFDRSKKKLYKKIDRDTSGFGFALASISGIVILIIFNCQILVFVCLSRSLGIAENMQSNRILEI